MEVELLNYPIEMGRDYTFGNVEIISVRSPFLTGRVVHQMWYSPDSLKDASGSVTL